MVKRAAARGRLLPSLAVSLGTMSLLVGHYKGGRCGVNAESSTLCAHKRVGTEDNGQCCASGFVTHSSRSGNPAPHLGGYFSTWRKNVR